MPPCTPPERLAAVRGRPSGPGTNGSLCSMPVMRVPAKPLPISKPLEAGSDSRPRARSASSLSKTGSPSPGGTPRATHSTTPPSESPRSRAASMASIICARRRRDRGSAPGSPRPPRASRASPSTFASTSCTRCTHAMTSTPAASRSSLRAIAPGRDAADRLARAGAAAALPVADAVLGLGGVVGVRRAGRRPSCARRRRGARPRCAPAARSACRACGPRRRRRGSRRGPPPGAASSAGSARAGAGRDRAGCRRRRARGAAGSRRPRRRRRRRGSRRRWRCGTRDRSGCS